MKYKDTLLDSLIEIVDSCEPSILQIYTDDGKSFDVPVDKIEIKSNEIIVTSEPLDISIEPNIVHVLDKDRILLYFSAFGKLGSRFICRTGANNKC